jgi:hypothetical protein
MSADSTSTNTTRLHDRARQWHTIIHQYIQHYMTTSTSSSIPPLSRPSSDSGGRKTARRGSPVRQQQLPIALAFTDRREYALTSARRDLNHSLPPTSSSSRDVEAMVLQPDTNRNTNNVVEHRIASYRHLFDLTHVDPNIYPATTSLTPTPLSRTISGNSSSPSSSMAAATVASFLASSSYRVFDRMNERIGEELDEIVGWMIDALEPLHTL